MEISFHRRRDDTLFKKACLSLRIDGQGRLFSDRSRPEKLIASLSPITPFIWIAPDGTQLSDLRIIGSDLSLIYQDQEIRSNEELWISPLPPLAGGSSNNLRRIKFRSIGDDGLKPLLTAHLHDDGLLLFKGGCYDPNPPFVPEIRVIDNSRQPFLVPRRLRLSSLAQTKK